MDPREEEEQRRIDEEARRAAEEAESQALDGLAGRTSEALAPVTGEPAASRRVLELPADPELDRVTAQPDAPDAFPHDYDSTGTQSQAVDYGAAGQRQMDDFIAGQHPSTDPADYEGDYADAVAAHAPEPLARDDAEPLGDVSRTGPHEGQMWAPSGTPESVEQRFARLGVGGDFSGSEIAPAAHGWALDSDPVLPGSLRDEPEAVDNPVEEAAEGDALSSLAGKPPRDEARDAAAGPLPRLDDGLPTEAEIADARDNPVEGFFHSLQNGLLGAIGRPRRDFNARADALEQQRQTGLERRQGAKNSQRQAEATAARQSQLDARAQQQLEQGDRRLDIAQQQAQTQADATRALVEQRTAQTEHLTTADEIARASRAEREDPTSPISMGAQQAVRTSLAALPEGLRTRLEASFADDLDTMSAAQLESTVRRLQTIGVRGTGGGSGGGGTTSALAQQLVDRGVAQSLEEAQQIISALGTRGARTSVQAALTPTARRAAAGGEGVEILPGVRATLADNIEARSIRTGFASARTQYASLGEVESIAARFGRSGPISPEAAGELGGPLSRLRAMVATLQNTGVINPSEAPTIEAMLPDPRSVSQMTFDTLQGRLRSFRTELDSQVTSQLATRGVDEAGIQTALRQLHGAVGAGGGSRSSATPSTSGMVRMRLPSGEVRRFPASAVEQAEGLGAVRL